MLPSNMAVLLGPPSQGCRGDRRRLTWRPLMTADVPSGGKQGVSVCALMLFGLENAFATAQWLMPLSSVVV